MKFIDHSLFKKEPLEARQNILSLPLKGGKPVDIFLSTSDNTQFAKHFTEQDGFREFRDIYFPLFVNEGYQIKDGTLFFQQDSSSYDDKKRLDTILSFYKDGPVGLSFATDSAAADSSALKEWFLNLKNK